MLFEVFVSFLCTFISFSLAHHMSDEKKTLLFINGTISMVDKMLIAGNGSNLIICYRLKHARKQQPINSYADNISRLTPITLDHALDW